MYCQKVLLFYSVRYLVSVVPGGTDFVTHVLPPMVQPFPMTVCPPSMVAFEYMVTLSSMVGCRFLFMSPLLTLSAPSVTPW